MLFNLRLLLSFIRKYGISSGVILFIKIKLNRLEKLTIPELKYPFRLRKGTTDINVFYQVFSEREYDNNLPIVPKTIIDAGANIGLTSIFLANKYPEANIIAIEPDIENYELLCQNIAYYKQIRTLHKGLWNKDVHLKISDKFNGGKWAMVVEEVGEQEPYDIDAISINKIMELYKLNSIDLLKMDIESAEKEVLSENYSNWLPKVKILIVELHDRMKPGCSKALFNAINSTMTDFYVKSNGENLIIINQGLIES